MPRYNNAANNTPTLVIVLKIPKLDVVACGLSPLAKRPIQSVATSLATFCWVSLFLHQWLRSVPQDTFYPSKTIH